jgi:aminoglycoside phosphotransferase family enzyme
MTSEASQQPVIDFLSDPANHGGASVKRIDTHIASVFLVGERALKIKRAVRFPFLDFSTLKARRMACEAEIAVNRAFAPSLYRRVLAITREINRYLALGGKGEPVEWAVEMRRFDESQTCDHLADAGRLNEALADLLGRAVAAAHRVAPTVTNSHFTEALAEIIEQNEAELASEPSVSLQDLRALAVSAQAALERVKPLLLARERASLVRRCHGDLHLGNIVLIDGKPVLFDAIEFDDRIATGDVLYDLAFLLMDLIERDLHQAANIVLNRYLADTQRIYDLDALAALPLFMSTRAAIRAKVTAARLRQTGSQAELTHGPRIMLRWRKNSCCQESPGWLRSADYPAQGSRCSRARWRPAFIHCRALWCYAAMSSARLCLVRLKPTNCLNPPTPQPLPLKGMQRLPKRLAARCRPAIRSSWMPCSPDRVSVMRSQRSHQMHSRASF